MFKAPARIYAAMKCQLKGHAHCKQVLRKTLHGPCLDCIVHYANGRRYIENLPQV